MAQHQAGMEPGAREVTDVAARTRRVHLSGRAC
jgi:hypothetical protein